MIYKKTGGLFIMAILIFSAVSALRPPLSLTDKTALDLPPRTGSCSLLVIRVEFETDTDPSTTGDGRFTIRSLADSQAQPFLYDYFTLFGLTEKESPFRTTGGTEAFPYYTLNEYFREVSGDLFRLETITVTSQIYVTNGKTMAYFGGNDNQEMRLCELADSALVMAQNDYDFSQYDYIALLHAGAGEEFDMNQDSPDDILTTSFTPEAYEEITGTPLRSDVANGVMIIPETENQDRGPDDMPLSILGPSAFSLGTLMGMPTTYDLSGQTSGAGMWDLMSYGFSHYLGFLPMPPSGYIKAEMGWADFILLDSKGLFSLEPFSCDVKEDIWNGNHLYKIVIGKDEYFLLEYRNGQGIGKAFQAYTYLGREGDYYIMEPSERALPGITIWHVNEDVIALDPDNLNGLQGKGLDLEEADGLNDLDRPLGSPGSLGDRLDCFNSGTWDIFSDETSPSACDDRGGRSGIRLTGLKAESGAGSVTVESARPDFFPLTVPGILEASREAFVTSTRAYTAEGVFLFSFEGQAPLLLDRTFLFTDQSLYSLPDGALLRTWDSFIGGELLEARREDGAYFLRTGEKSFLYDETFTLLASADRPGTLFLGLAGSSTAALSQGVLYLDDSPVMEGVDDVRICNGDIFVFREGHFYRIAPGHTTPSLFPASAVDAKDFFPLDYDGDGVTELFALTPDNLVILNETGPEKSYRLSGFREMVPFEKGDRLRILLTGDRTAVLELYPEEILLFTGKDSCFAGAGGGDLLYRNEDSFYGMTLYDRLLRDGAVLVQPGEGTWTPPADRAVYAYPNPVRGETLYVRFSAVSGKKALLTLYNAAMEEVKRAGADTIAGENNIGLSLAGVPKGTYLIKLKYGEETHFIKVVRL